MIRHHQKGLITAICAAVIAFAVTTPAQDEKIRVITMPTPEELEDAGQPHGIVIEQDFLRSWRKLRDQAVSNGATVIIIEIPTPGGELFTTRQFAKDLVALHADGIRTIAYVPFSATSAGAIMATACGELAMSTGALIGNAIPLEFHDLEGYRAAPSKILSELIGDMDAIAAQSGFDREVLRSMVDQEMELWAVWRRDGSGTVFVSGTEYTKNHRNDVEQKTAKSKLLVDSGHALKYVAGAGHYNVPGWGDAFPFTVCNDRRDLLRALGLADRDLAPEEILVMPAPKGLGYMVHLLGQIDWTLLLLFAGITCFVLEFKTPGLGIFGVLGLLSFVAYFVANEGSGLPVAFSVGLLVLGLFLLFAELFIIPGFGIAGISGIAVIVFSIYSATVGLQGETLGERLMPDSDGDWVMVQAWLTMFLGMAVLGTVGALTFAKSLHHIPLLNRAFVNPPAHQRPDERPPTGVTSYGRVKVGAGARGTADTDLRPAGKATFEQGLLDVVSEGEWIPRGTPVEVVLVEGVRVVVRPSGPVGEEPAS